MKVAFGAALVCGIVILVTRAPIFSAPRILVCNQNTVNYTATKSIAVIRNKNEQLCAHLYVY